MSKEHRRIFGERCFTSSCEKIGYPIMMRSGFSLGGLGSGKINDKHELEYRAKEALSGSPQILIEEYLVRLERTRI